MGYAQARTLATEKIPVIDIGPLRDGSDPETVARALHAASRELGFIYVAGHGIPAAVIEPAREAAYAFFRRPELDKETVRVSARHRGWLGRGGARMDDDARPDLKESFVWGLEDALGETPEDHPLRGPNRWPSFLPELRIHALAWFDHAHRVARHLMGGFALGLGLDEHYRRGS